MKTISKRLVADVQLLVKMDEIEFARLLGELLRRKRLRGEKNIGECRKVLNKLEDGKRIRTFTFTQSDHSAEVMLSIAFDGEDSFHYFKIRGNFFDGKIETIHASESYWHIQAAISGISLFKCCRAGEEKQ